MKPKSAYLTGCAATLLIAGALYASYRVKLRNLDEQLAAAEAQRGPSFARKCDDAPASWLLPRTIWRVRLLNRVGTRADVEKDFAQRPGLFNPAAPTYAARSCPLIQIDVAYSRDGKPVTDLKEEPTDRVHSINGPYLALP